ncbi:MAG TPA: hypothetical protein VII30_10245, partial [Gemmatimonadaceae bacterium]
LPLVERHPVPVVVKMTLEAVFVKPDHGVQSPGAGTAKSRPMKLVPPHRSRSPFEHVVIRHVASPRLLLW